VRTLTVPRNGNCPQLVCLAATRIRNSTMPRNASAKWGQSAAVSAIGCPHFSLPSRVANATASRMTRAFGGRALWWLVLALVIAACGSGDEGERLGQARSAVNAGQSLVIRQIYPRPGTYSRAFVEIYNRGTAPASLAGL